MWNLLRKIQIQGILGLCPFLSDNIVGLWCLVVPSRGWITFRETWKQKEEQQRAAATARWEAPGCAKEGSQRSTGQNRNPRAHPLSRDKQHLQGATAKRGRLSSLGDWKQSLTSGSAYRYPKWGHTMAFGHCHPGKVGWKMPLRVTLHDPETAGTNTEWSRSGTWSQSDS